MLLFRYTLSKEMHMRQTRQVIILCTILIFAFSNAFAIENHKYSTRPITNKGEKWRIGYLEGGPYSNYPTNLRALVEALSEMRWIDEADLPPQTSEDDTSQLWAWICEKTKSKYIQFVSDAYWSSNWENELRFKNKQAVIHRLNTQKDIDLMLAMGTKAGQDLANNEHSVPVIVMSSSNPIGSKIIKSAQDSGFDHVNARVDPTRYERQIRIFHDIIGFEKLGIVYETHTVDGRTYAAVSDVEKVAKERGFEVVSCHAPFSNISKEKAEQAVIKCHNELAPKVDAFYITVHRGVALSKMPELLAPFFKHKISTFSQRGSREVQYGALLSIARAGFKFIAGFHAETIAKIFNGAKPRDLEQVFEDPPRIAINLKTAEKIGYTPPVDILGAADEIYDKIEK